LAQGINTVSTLQIQQSPRLNQTSVETLAVIPTTPPSLAVFVKSWPVIVNRTYSEFPGINTGNLTLTSLAVTDALAPACNHTIDSLVPGVSSSTFSCDLASVTTGFINTASVTAQPAPGSRLSNLSILTSIDSAGDSFTLGYVVGGTGTSERVTDLTPAEVQAYLAGYQYNEQFGDKKSWD
jgi:hypothetical protein